MKERDKFIKMKTAEVIKEHKRLTGVLKRPTKASLKGELRKQSNELQGYER